MNRNEAVKIFEASPIYGITAEHLSAGRKNIEVVQAMLDGGLRFIQYREKEKKAGVMYEECMAIRALTKKYQAVFVVDDFIDLAIAVDADGVHIGQEDLPPQVVRQMVGPDKVIGFSTHNPSQLDAANQISGLLDYLGVGPTYETHTKKNPAPVAGLDYVQYAAQHSVLPFVAIGGIKEHNIADVAQAGATHAAVVSEIVGAADIPAKIHSLRQQIEGIDS